MTYAFLGIGQVGFALANRLEGWGHSILIAHDDPASASVRQALSRNPRMRVLPVAAAVAEADAVFLAIPFGSCPEVLPGLVLDGKILVDCTNPVGPGLTHGLQSARAGSEVIQELAPGARVVKAFSVYGFENFAEPFPPAGSVRPAMFIAGNDPQAKAFVTGINDALGFDTVDAGALPRALHLEHMTLLWVSLVRAGGADPRLTWARLQA